MLYDRLLERQIRDGPVPEHLVLTLDETDLLRADGFATLASFFDWCRGLGLDRVRVNVDVLDGEHRAIELVREGLGELPDDVRVTTGDERVADAPYAVSVGVGGRGEFVGALRELAEEVEAGSLEPGSIDEADVERRLRFDGEPDMVIKTGGQHLTDFMIWQSVYSELYFADVNWQNFRRRDLLRSIRDFQERERRFGR